MVVTSPFTVCTPSMPERADRLIELRASLAAQTHQPATWLIRIEQPHEFGFAHLAHQRNALLKAVETEWLATVDDDDLLDPDYFEEMAKHTDDADMIWAYCRGRHDLHYGWDPERLREANYICGVACIRTELAREVGGWTEDGRYEDWIMWLRLLDAGARFHCVERPMWTHRRGDWRTIT